MSLTLTTVRNQVETQLTDTSNLIWPEATIDQAIRTALAEISQIYGEALTLDGLDTETTTTIEEQDIFVLVTGAMVYCLLFRVTERYEEASPNREDIDDLVKAKDKNLDLYQGLLHQLKTRFFHESTTSPISEWEWDEEDVFF